MGLWAYEQDLSLELVAEYVVFNWNKHTMLLQAIGKMLGKAGTPGEKLNQASFPESDLELWEYYQDQISQKLK